ncbi:RibD family protein [Ningiella sp. W23]|uniref:RibD family protein n=1 Tax=Ningiella sp. W23 TaxID=3023715 RepID=UPI0037564FAD
MNDLNHYWTHILALKTACKSHEESFFIIGFSAEGFHFIDQSTWQRQYQNDEPALYGFELLIASKSITISAYEQQEVFSDRLFLYFKKGLDGQLKSFLQLYVPLATSSLHHSNTPFVIAHMAQSLDGKVCTLSGTSKWIGNQQNLEHAHRIRALVDGVLVGGNTARSEKPSLNVRHVFGPNPARIILCSSSHELNGLPDIPEMRNYLLCRHECVAKINLAELKLNQVRTLGYSGKQADRGVADALAKLACENIHSILVEGGPTTIQAFLRSNALCWLQLHVAPLVFGSGHSLVSLPEITEVNQAQALTNVIYTQMGDAIMVTGQL